MMKNIKQIAFVIVGLTIVTTFFLMLRSSPVEASEKDGKKFDDWVVTCTKEDEKTKTPATCFLSQSVNLTKDGKQQQIALYQVGYFGPKKELKMVYVLPNSVRVDVGTSIISDKKLISAGKFTVCNQTGCQAISDVSDADLKAIQSASENFITFMDSEAKQINFPLSNKGLAEGLKFIK